MQLQWIIMIRLSPQQIHRKNIPVITGPPLCQPLRRWRPEISPTPSTPQKTRLDFRGFLGQTLRLTKSMSSKQAANKIEAT
jgi:hypothetical protein